MNLYVTTTLTHLVATSLLTLSCNISDPQSNALQSQTNPTTLEVFDTRNIPNILTEKREKSLMGNILTADPVLLSNNAFETASPDVWCFIPTGIYTLATEPKQTAGVTGSGSFIEVNFTDTSKLIGCGDFVGTQAYIYETHVRSSVSESCLVRPVKSAINFKGFGSTMRGQHEGLDFAPSEQEDPSNIPIFAVTRSKVLSASVGEEQDKAWGHYITLEHIDSTEKATGLKSHYAHMAKPPTATVGDIIECGTEIGILGQTGARVLSPHLHFDTSEGSNKIEPMKALGIGAANSIGKRAGDAEKWH